MAPTCPPPVRAVGSRITATRVTVGAAIQLSVLLIIGIHWSKLGGAIAV
jgi:hypothetical protein